jgi:hypothetical protein
MNSPRSLFQHTITRLAFTTLFYLLVTTFAHSQTATLEVPHMVLFNGVTKDASGKPVTGTLGITFAIYKDEEGGAPLWMEVQNAIADADGHYSVYLGATKSDGLPQDSFVSGETRWLGIQMEGQKEQPRTLLLSVPYALKAGFRSLLSRTRSVQSGTRAVRAGQSAWLNEEWKAVFHYYYGYTLYELKAFQQAKREFILCLQSGPSGPEPALRYSMLAATSRKLGERSEAASFEERAKSLKR